MILDVLDVEGNKGLSWREEMLMVYIYICWYIYIIKLISYLKGLTGIKDINVVWYKESVEESLKGNVLNG
jgi:hypothetical protein